MLKFRILIVLLVLLSLAVPVFAEEPAGVAKLTYGPDAWIKLDLLLQVQYESAKTWIGKEKEADAIWTNSFFLRRCRVIVQGQAAKNVTFFMETDDLNVGRTDNTANSGSVSGTTDKVDGSTAGVKHSHTVTGSVKNNAYTQDAFINYKVADELQIAAGMILLPFMHNNRQSAASLLGVDYNSKAVVLPNTNVWRDTGVEFRGLIGKGPSIDYRVGAFQGLSASAGATDTDARDNVNRKDRPRITGRVQINFADAEDGFFYSGNYLGKKKILSIGGGIDYQQDVARGGTNAVTTAPVSYTYQKDYFAWTGDATIDYPMGGVVLAFQCAYMSGKNNPSLYAKDSSGLITVNRSGNYEYVRYNSYFAQMGLLITDLNIQPVLKYVAYNEDEIKNAAGNTINTTKKQKWVSAGVNYLINGHSANIKVEYIHPFSDYVNNTTGEKKVIVQGQIFI